MNRYTADAYSLMGSICHALNDCYIDYSHCAKEAAMRKTKTIKNVIFNDPATIVFWEDGSKTVVKRLEDEVFDPEKGLAMAIAKKSLGNQGNYYEVFKKWLPTEL